MQTILPVVAILGVIVMVFAGSMLVPLALAWWGHDAAHASYQASIAITFACGLAMWLVARRHRRELQPRDGVLLVSSVWTLLPLFACMPLLAWSHQAGRPMSFTDAYFEAMSGLTTTGATVLANLDTLPPSINLWRCFMQWMGGMGILVLAVAILPLLGVGGSQLFKAEAAGPLKDTKLTPRITQTAKGLWSVYVVFSLACLLAYRAAGMSWLDALMHMFSTISLGGLSPYDASFGKFASPLLEWICVVFMLVASCNFALYFGAFHKRSLARLRADPELRATLGVMVGSSLLVAVVLWAKGTYSDPLVTIRMAFFNVVSVASTTGYANTDYSRWPIFAPVLMLLLSGVATSAGSTGAGIKMIRVLILVKQSTRELSRIVHPRAVNPVILGDRIIAPGAIFAVLAYMLVYGATVVVLGMVMLLTDLDEVTAFTAVLASVNNMGPGLNQVGPAASFAVLTDFQTWVCTIAMLLGRLEMLSFMALLAPSFWRK